MTTIASLVVEFGANGRAFERSLRETDGLLRRTSRRITAGTRAWDRYHAAVDAVRVAQEGQIARAPRRLALIGSETELIGRLGEQTDDSAVSLGRFSDIVGRSFRTAAGSIAGSSRRSENALEALRATAVGVLRDIQNEILRTFVLNPLGKQRGGFLGGLFGGLTGLFGGGGGLVGSTVGFPGLSGAPSFAFTAKGNVFDRGRLVPFASGGLIDRPTLFPLKGGVGLAGEAGREAVLPLRRGPGGRLGVEASGGGGITIVQNMDLRGADPGTFSRAQAFKEDIKRETMAAVFDAINSGGAAAKMVGRRRPR